MNLQAKTAFAELMDRARDAMFVAQAHAGMNDSAVLNAASAASRAAGFIEAVILTDPATAKDMVVEFESLVDDAHREMAADAG